MQTLCNIMFYTDDIGKYIRQLSNWVEDNPRKRDKTTKHGLLRHINLEPQTFIEKLINNENVTAVCSFTPLMFFLSFFGIWNIFDERINEKEIDKVLIYVNINLKKKNRFSYFAKFSLDTKKILLRALKMSSRRLANCWTHKK